MFDRISGSYDFLNSLLSAKQDARWRRHMIAMVPDRKGGSLLDVATGTGDVILNVAKSRSDYHTLVGVDISEQMLAKAKQKAKSKTPESDISFRKMSAENLEFPDETFDCITISFGLRNVVNKDNAIAEFYRILKTDGQLLILEFFPPQKGILSKLFMFYFLTILPRIGGLFSDRSAYQYLPKSVLGFGSMDELRKTLTRHGLVWEQQKSFLFGACRLLKLRRP
jgi:demethylmenaquinone methyltransferase/2-methoxy-6-polyprenyl-1,4-benzoquinol methylase